MPRQLVSAKFEIDSRIRAFGSARFFGHDAQRVKAALGERTGEWC